MSKKCTFCGSEVDDNSKFCMFCGSPVKDMDNDIVVEPEETVNTEENIENISSEDIVENNTDNSENDYFDLGREPKFNDEIFGSESIDDSYNEQQSINDTNKNQQNDQIGFAIASLVLGILSLVCCCSIYVGLLFAIASIVFGVISIKNNYSGRGMAIAGIICSGISLLIYIIFAIFAGTLAFFDGALSDNIGDSISDFIDSI